MPAAERLRGGILRPHVGALRLPLPGRPLLRGMLVGLIYMAVGVMLYAVLTAQHLSPYAYAADILMGVAAGGLIAMLRARKR